MSRDTRFSVLVVRGDGQRVLRFRIPRPFAVTLGLAMLVLVTGLGILVGEWWYLRRVAVVDMRAAAESTTAREHTIQALNERVAEIRQEVLGWRQIHARLWEPFGPEIMPGAPGTGIGGGAGAQPATVAMVAADEVSALAESVAATGESLRALDRVFARIGKMLALLPSVWPVQGSVNSEFGRRTSPWSRGQEYHAGIDIAAERGTPVRAPAAGVVAVAGPQAQYGLTVVLDHGQDIRTIYAHLSKLRVAVGDTVERGAEIALTGNSGRSSGPHLHYEILVRGQPVNPRLYLWD